MNYDELDLSELFAESDRIGDRYLSAEEIQERDRELAEIRREVLAMLGSED